MTRDDYFVCVQCDAGGWRPKANQGYMTRAKLGNKLGPLNLTLEGKSEVESRDIRLDIMVSWWTCAGSIYIFQGLS